MSAPVISCLICGESYDAREAEKLERLDESADGMASILCQCGQTLRLPSELLSAELLWPATTWQAMFPLSRRPVLRSKQLPDLPIGWFLLTAAILAMLGVMVWI